MLWYNVSNSGRVLVKSLATRCSHMMTHSSVCCGNLRISGPSAWGMSWSQDIFHRRTAHWRSVAPHDPIFSTTVKYNHQSLLCFLLYPLCIFLPGLLKRFPSQHPPSSSSTSSTFLLSSFSVLKSTTSNLSVSPLSYFDTHVHTHMRTKTHAGAFRPQELWCIMTDNWLLWVCPRQQEPITVTATSPWPVYACMSVCEHECLNVCEMHWLNFILMSAFVVLWISVSMHHTVCNWQISLHFISLSLFHACKHKSDIELHFSVCVWVCVCACRIWISTANYIRMCL